MSDLARIGFGLLAIGALTAPLVVARVVERSASRWPASRHHALHLLALVGFALAILVGAVRLSSITLRPEHAELPTAAHFAFSAHGKFPDLERAAGSRTTHDDGRRAASLGPAVLLGVWLCGFLLCLARIAHRGYRLARVLARSRPVDPALERRIRSVSRRLGHDRRLRVRVSPEVGSPMIWGPPRVTLLLPPGWLGSGNAELRLLLAHELAHVDRRDSLALVVSELCCAIGWFHPLARHAARRIESLQELSADSRVIERGVRVSDYGTFLLNATRRSLSPVPAHLPSALSVLGVDPLTERIRRLTGRQPPRRPGNVLSRAAAAVLALGLWALPPALTLPVATAMARADTPGWTHAEIDAVLNPVFVNKMQDLHVAGAAVSVVHGGKTVYARGWGRAEVFEPRPVDPARTIFRIGSVSKVMTGVAVMQLVDRGLLDLDADVNRYLTAFQVDDTFDEPVRVRHLLTHTAGFDQLGYGRHADSRKDVRPLGEFLSENLVRIRRPGELSCYDTYAITLAGYLVEVVSGVPYERYLVENIFRPLEMYRSGITVPEALAGDVAIGYEFAGEWSPQAWEFMNTDPASTINSTVTDMAHFAQMMLAGGEYRGRRILSRKSVHEMLRLQYTNDPRLPGYGLTFWEHRSFGVDGFSHGGSMTGYSCFLLLLPQHDLAVFVAYNQESGALISLTIGELIRAFFPDARQPETQRPAWNGAADPARFAGSYTSNMYNHTRPERGGWRSRPFELTVDEQGRLVFRGQPCRQVDRLAFERDDGLLLVFRESAEGDITHLLVEQTVYERVP